MEERRLPRRAVNPSASSFDPWAAAALFLSKKQDIACERDSCRDNGHIAAFLFFASTGRGVPDRFFFADLI